MGNKEALGDRFIQKLEAQSKRFKIIIALIFICLVCDHVFTKQNKITDIWMSKTDVTFKPHRIEKTEKDGGIEGSIDHLPPPTNTKLAIIYTEKAPSQQPKTK